MMLMQYFWKQFQFILEGVHSQTVNHFLLSKNNFFQHESFLLDYIYLRFGRHMYMS